MNTAIFGLMLAALPAVCGAADMEFFDAASVSFPALSVPVGVRATAMGNAYTAAGDDAYALNWNPAGLARLHDYELGLADNEWSSALGVRQQLLSYGQPLGQDAGLGISVNYFALGQLDQRDSAGALKGKSQASMLALSAGYAWSMLERDRLKTGLAFEFGTQSLYGGSQTEMGANLGLLYDFTPESSAGISVNHLGMAAPGFNPPQSLSLGAVTHAFGRQLTAALDAQLPFYASAMLNTGLEYWVSVLALRAGYRLALGAPDADVQSGLSAGLGVKAGVFSLDYAYVPYGVVSTAHRVQATLALPGDFFRARLAGPEGTSATAEAYYNAALALEKGGETLKALIQYQRCEESYPSGLKKNPQDFYVSAKKKIDELQAQMEKGGDHGQIQKLTKENIGSAEKDIKAGRYKDALDELTLAKKIDPSSPVIEKLMKEARRGLDEKLSIYRNAARFAANEGNLAMSVENYKKLLGSDPNDGEALAYLSKNRGGIKTMLQAANRKGIFFYVGGNVEEAIKTWTDAQALDYFGDIDFKRDIDKARKQLEATGKN